MSKRRVSPLDAKSAASLTERTMELTNELGVLAVEALETLAESKTVVEVLAKWLGLSGAMFGDRGAPAAPAAGAPADRRGEVFVSSRKPAKVEARFFAPPPADARVPGLHRPDTPPIVGVEYLGQTHGFRVSIPDEQPAGVYYGVIVGRDGDNPLGTIVATVADI